MHIFYSLFGLKHKQKTHTDILEVFDSPDMDTINLSRSFCVDPQIEFLN